MPNGARPVLRLVLALALRPQAALGPCWGRAGALALATGRAGALALRARPWPAVTPRLACQACEFNVIDLLLLLNVVAEMEACSMDH